MKKHAIALAVLAAAIMAGMSARAAVASPLPTYKLTLTPNWVTPDDPVSANYNAIWLKGKSATTPFISPDSLHHAQRYLLVDPRYSDGYGHQGNDEWWFVFDRNWPAAFPATNHGDWGRFFNLHNVAGDAGPKNSGGVGWDFGTGVSSVALDFWSAAPELSVEPMAPNNHFALPVPTEPITVSQLWHPRLDADQAHRWLRGHVRDICAAIR